MSHLSKIKSLLQLYIYSNFHIALAAVCFLWGNGILLGFSINFSLSVYVFASTLFTYQLSRYALFKSKVFESVEGDELYGFTQNNLRFTFLSLLISAIIALVLFFEMPGQVKKWSVLLGLISFMYSLKIHTKSFAFRLRDIPFLKIFIIAFVWASMGVAFNYGYNELPVDWNFFLIQYLFIIIITLPFDIKDLQTDMMTNVKTIPTVMGKDFAQMITLVATAFYFVFFNVMFSNLSLVFIMLYGLLMIFLVVLNFAKLSQMKKWKVMMIYDGSMILFFLLSLLN